MKVIVPIILCLSICFTSIAQSGCSVKKAYAFYTVTLPGMAIADEDGNTINPTPVISRFIYLEWKGSDNPVVENVLYDNKLYTTDISAIEGNSVIPGDDVENNREHKIIIKKCNRLWKITVHPSVDPKTDKQGSKKITIRFKGKDKPCEIRLVKETELMTLPRY